MLADTSNERKVIAKMTELKEIVRVWEMGLRPEHFTEPIARAVFEYVIDYWKSYRMAPTWVVLETEFPAFPLPNADEDATEWLVTRMQQDYSAARVYDLLREAAKTTNDDPHGTANWLYREAYEISESVAPRSLRSDMSQNTDDRRARYEHLRENNAAVGAPYGLAQLDTHTRGVLPGELSVVAAFTKVGKSFLLCHSAVAAHRAGLRPILFTLEMNIAEMEQRIDALYSGVSSTRLQEGTLMPQERDRLHAAQEELRENGRLHVERGARGERTVKQMLNRAREVEADYVLIDQLSFMDAETDYSGDSAMRMKHGEIVFDLKDEIARESMGKMPCMLAVQLNRATMRDRQSGGRGELQNLANSSFIEQTADAVIGLWRTNDLRANNLMGCDIMGHRRADKQSYLLSWDLSHRTRIRVRDVLED